MSSHNLSKHFYEHEAEHEVHDIHFSFYYYSLLIYLLFILLNGIR